MEFLRMIEKNPEIYAAQSTTSIVDIGTKNVIEIKSHLYIRLTKIFFLHIVLFFLRKNYHFRFNLRHFK